MRNEILYVGDIHNYLPAGARSTNPLFTPFNQNWFGQNPIFQLALTFYTTCPFSFYLPFFARASSPGGFLVFFLLEQGPLVGLWCFWCFFLLEQGPLVGEATLGWNSPAVQCQNAPRLFFQRHFARFPRAPLPLSFVAMQFAEQII